MCPPQLFSKQDVPQDYAFRSYYGSDPDSFKAGEHKQPQSSGKARAAAATASHRFSACARPVLRHQLEARAQLNCP